MDTPATKRVALVMIEITEDDDGVKTRVITKPDQATFYALADYVSLRRLRINALMKRHTAKRMTLADHVDLWERAFLDSEDSGGRIQPKGPRHG